MTPKIPGYAEVRLVGREKRFIKITQETPTQVTGWRVNKDGSRWERETKATTQVNLVICHPDAIVRRLVLNTFYGELENVSTEQ